MEESKIEIVKYPKIKHIKIFVNKINFVENHIHNDFELFIVLDGKGFVTLNSVKQEFNKGDMFLINSGDVHALSLDVKKEKEVQNDFTSLFIQISNQFIRDYFPPINTTIFESLNLKKIFNTQDYNKMLSLLIDSSISYFSEPEYFQLEIVSNISRALTHIFKNVKHEVINETQKMRIQKHQRRLERISSYIEENFDSKIKLEDLAKKENLSITHLSHLFSSNFGMTFQEYVNTKRMEQCIRLMANKEKTLLEIAYESGFSDSKYMNKMFLKRFGCTPKEYRKKYSMIVEKESDSILQIGKLEVIYNDSVSLQKVEEFAKSNL